MGSKNESMHNVRSTVGYMVKRFLLDHVPAWQHCLRCSYSVSSCPYHHWPASTPSPRTPTPPSYAPPPQTTTPPNKNPSLPTPPSPPAKQAYTVTLTTSYEGSSGSHSESLTLTAAGSPLSVNLTGPSGSIPLKQGGGETLVYDGQGSLDPDDPLNSR